MKRYSVWGLQIKIERTSRKGKKVVRVYRSSSKRLARLPRLGWVMDSNGWYTR
jgi:hypothetical protein